MSAPGPIRSAAGTKDNWATPQYIFDHWNKRYDFDLDAAADASNAKCEDYLDEEYNSLIRPWGTNRRVWLNPPFNGGRVKSEKWYTEAEGDIPCLCQCHKPSPVLGATNSGLKLSNSSAQNQPSATASPHGAAIASGNLPEGDRPNGAATRPFETSYSPRSADTRPRPRAANESAESQPSTITEGERPISRFSGASDSGRTPSDGGSGDAPTAEPTATSGRTTSSHSTPSSAPALFHGTSSHAARPVTLPKLEQVDPSGLPIGPISPNASCPTCSRCASRIETGPPGNLIGWIDACVRESQQGNIIVALLPNNTDSFWYHEAFRTANEITFLQGRINFIDPATGKAGKGNTGGSIFVTWLPPLFWDDGYPRSPSVRSLHIPRPKEAK